MPFIQAFGVGRHQAIFNSIMDHLDEMTGTVRSTVKIALLGGAVSSVATEGTWRCTNPGRQCGKDRIEMLDNPVFPADHQAVSTLTARNAPACPHVDVMNPLGP